MLIHTSSPKRRLREERRRQALELAEGGLNKRGGPVDKGTPDSQKAAAQRMQGPKREARNDQLKASLGRPEVNRNESSPRFGQRFRTILRKGGEIHDYGSGGRVFVRKPESGGTGNHPPKGIMDYGRSLGTQRGSRGNGQSSIPGMIADPARPAGQPKRTTDNVLKPVERAHKPASSTYDRMARDLAKRRATENKPNARRKLAVLSSYGRADGDTNGPWRRSEGRKIRRARRQANFEKKYRRSLQ